MMPMTDDQAIRMQCLELAVKAGTPWDRLTETADMLTAYVRGINARVATDQIDSLTPAGLAEYRRTGEISTDTAISAADKGVAVEETMPLSEWRFPAYLGDPSYSKTLAAVEDEMAKGEPVEDSSNWPYDIPGPTAEEIDRAVRVLTRGEPVEEPPPGVANDPRLPTVTM